MGSVGSNPTHSSNSLLFRIVVVHLSLKQRVLVRFQEGQPIRNWNAIASVTQHRCGKGSNLFKIDPLVTVSQPDR